MSSQHHHQSHQPESPETPTSPDQQTHAMHAPPEMADHGGHQPGHGGHNKHAGHGEHGELFRQKFWVSLLLAVPIVLTSEMIQDWLNYSLPDFPGDSLIGPVLGTILFLYGGGVFLQGGWQEIKSRQPGMMLLISLAISVAYIASIATTFDWFDLDFWWELALLIVIMLFGHWQEMRALGQAQGALGALAELLPDEAERITEDGTERVPISALVKGDLVLIRPGERVPADGHIVEGNAELDESMITGESRPVPRGVGDRIVAGTVVAGSSLQAEVDAVGEETALAGIQRLVEEAQTSHSRAQALADRFAAALFYIAVAVAIVTFIVWTAIGNLDEAVTRTVTVLVISCPHALGLAIPLVIAISTSLAARNGMLIRDRLALERMRLIDTVLFDKTGTLTKGEPTVSEIASVSGDDNALLILAAAVEADSEHPLAKAIVNSAKERELRSVTARDFKAVAGRGVEARVDDQQVAVGGPALLRERSLRTPDALQAQTERWAARGATVLHVIANDEVIGAMALEDALRPESKPAIDDLHGLNVKAVMITGDARSVAEAVGRQTGVDAVLAEVLPEDKDAEVSRLQAAGDKVAMVGDGVNDAPALARADVGIAIGAGTDVAIQSAGVILATSDPRAVGSVIRLSRASYRKMIQNLAWAAGYNLVTIPLAAGVLAPIGFVLPPAIGAVLMSVSTIVVALNAQLLRVVRLRPSI